MKHPFNDAFIDDPAAADEIARAIEQYTPLTVQSVTEITTRALDRTRVVHLDTGGLYRVYVYDPDNTDEPDGEIVIHDSEDRPFVLHATITGAGGFDAYDTTANQGNYDGEAEGFRLFLVDAFDGDGGWVVRDDAGPGGWFGPFPFRGPEGAAGVSFDPDAVVPDLAGRAAHDDESQGFSVLVEADSSNGGLATLYFKLSAASADWSNGFTFSPAGPQGPSGTSALTRVRVVATGDVDIATGLEAGDTIDGVTLAQNDLVLIAGQTAPEQNGVYVVPASGAASRQADFDAYDDLPGTYFSVMEGNAKADTLWRCTSDRGGTIDTDPVSIAEFTSGGGGAGGGYFNVNRGGTGQTVSTGTPAKIQFTNQVADDDNTFDSSTAYRWTPGVVGRSMISAGVAFGSGLSPGVPVAAMLFKNGAVHRQVDEHAGGSAPLGVQLATIVDHDTDDYFEIYAYHEKGTDHTVSGAIHLTYFTGIGLDW